MRPVTAGALVFGTSAAVLVLEILAARLLAPYVGVTLATYTGIIGTILAAIAFGTWLGGRLADRYDPAGLLGPILVLGGGLSLTIVPIVRLVGGLPIGTGPAAVVILVTLAFFAPAAVLSAVPPTVVKMQLADLSTTGSTVGRISALGTAGAIVGTFATGFVLVATWPTTPIIVGVGVLLLLTGLIVEVARRRNRKAGFPGALAAAVIGVAAVGGAGAIGINATLDPCERESAYFCARVVPNLAGCPDGLTLYLDTVRHSCVHPDDPARLDFGYAQLFAEVATAKAPDGGPLDVVHVGGGGFSLPRWLEVTHPGSVSRVLELDPALVEIAQQQLGLALSDDLTVTTGDARLGLRNEPSASADMVFGDAFGGLSVPWHLTTVEWTEQVERVLRPDGVYVLNVIDYPPFGFARAETATLQKVFKQVAVLAAPGRVAGQSGGNLVLIGSNAPIDGAGIRAADEAAVARGERGAVLTEGDALAAFVDGADPLTDDFAPVDQLIALGRRP